MLKPNDVSHLLAEGATWSGQRGCPAELDQLYREHVQYVWRCVRHLGVRSSDLEDVTHEVFLVMSRKLATFEGRSSLKTWIYGICVRVSSDYRKKASFRREVQAVDMPDGEGDDNPSVNAEKSRFRDRLLVYLDALTSEQREVFVLYEIEELSMKEIAEITSSPLQTAYSRLHAARSALKARLTDEGLAHG